MTLGFQPREAGSIPAVPTGSVAQLDRAMDCLSIGCGFESRPYRCRVSYSGSTAGLGPGSGGSIPSTLITIVCGMFLILSTSKTVCTQSAQTIKSL